MMKKIILGIIMFILVLGIVNAQLIEPKEPKEPQEISYNLDTSVFGGVTVTRTETQAEFTPVSEEFIGSKFRVCFNELTIEDKVNLITAGHNLNDGVPVIDHRKTIFKVTEKEVIEKGKLVKQNVSEFTGYEKLKYLNHSAQDCVYIPLDSEGDIHIGFTSTIYTVDKFTYGSGNNVSNNANGVALANAHADYDSDMVLWMKFDENASDSSGLGNDGVVTGAVHNYSWYEFDGVGDFIESPHSNSLNFSNYNGITTSCWIKQKLRNDFRYLIDKDNIKVRMGYNSNRLNCYARNSTGVVVAELTSNVVLDETSFYHISCVFDKITHNISLYINGVFDKSTVDSGFLDFEDSTELLRIGYSHSGFNPFNGSIDEVIIYNRSLSSAEITALYNKGLFVKSPSYGNYTSGLIDLNTTREFKTVSWNWTGESGTNVTLRVQSASLAKPNISDEGLVGYWLDGTHGCDDVLGNNNGTAHGGVVCDGTDEGAFYGENATAFDGVDEYIRMDDLDNSSLSWTYSCWFKLNEDDSGAILDGGDHNPRVYYHDSNNKIKIDYKNLTGNYKGGTSTYDNSISLNIWYHITATYNTTHLVGYLDGVEKGSKAISGGVRESTSDMNVGYRWGEPINGSIAHVAIYNRSLSADEILNLSSWTSKLTDPSNSDISSLPDNRFYRFESVLNSDNTTHTPVLQWVDIVSSPYSYYVSNDGNDSNNGTTISSPWQTLTNINNGSFNPGDSIFFERGGNWSYLNFPSSGDSTAYITLDAYGIGDKPIIETANFYGAKDHIKIQNIEFHSNLTSSALHLQGSTNFIIDNITANGKFLSDKCGIHILKGGTKYSENITINNSIVKNIGIIGSNSSQIGLEISTRARYIIVENCVVNLTEGGGIQVYSGNISEPSYNVTIRNNQVYRNSTNRESGINIGWLAYNVIVENNTVDGGKICLSIDSNITGNNYIRNNVAKNCYELLIVMGNSHGNSSNSTVTGNTFIAGSNTVKGTWFESLGVFGGKNHVFRDNIVYGNNQWYPEHKLHINMSTSSDYNLFYDTSGIIRFERSRVYPINSLSAWQINTSDDNHSKVADPYFMDVANADYRPYNNSPACTMSSTGSYVGALPCYGYNTLPLNISSVNISFPLADNINTLESNFYYLYFDIYSYGIDQPNNKTMFGSNEFPKLNYVSNLGATTITGDRAETQYQVANVWRR